MFIDSVFGTETIVSLIEEFCIYLFVIMALWLFFQWTAHHRRVFSFRNHVKSFYTGLSEMGNNTFFPKYVETRFNSMEHMNRPPVFDPFMRLLTTYRNYRKDKNRYTYLLNVNEMRADARETFSRGSSQSLSIQMTTAFFVFGVLLSEVVFTDLRPSLPLWAVAVFTLSALWLYVSREKQGDRAITEIDKLESIYAKYLTAGDKPSM